MKCIIIECTREAGSRGLCSACYASAFNLIYQGKTTWKELEDRKLALSSKTSKSAFIKQFNS